TSLFGFAGRWMRFAYPPYPVTKGCRFYWQASHSGSSMAQALGATGAAGASAMSACGCGVQLPPLATIGSAAMGCPAWDDAWPTPGAVNAPDAAPLPSAPAAPVSPPLAPAPPWPPLLPTAFRR